MPKMPDYLETLSPETIKSMMYLSYLEQQIINLEQQVALAVASVQNSQTFIAEEYTNTHVREGLTQRKQDLSIAKLELSEAQSQFNSHPFLYEYQQLIQENE